MPAAPKAKRRRLRADERREKILAAAMAVFAERGYHRAAMTEIAAAAGITAAVIYDHFGSKAELQIELLERETEALFTFVGEALLAAPPVPAERMRRGMDAFFTFVERDPYAWRMLFREPSAADAEIEGAFRAIRARTNRGLAGFIRMSAPPEMLADRDAERDLEMFAEMMRMAQTALANWWWEHRDVPRAEVVDRMLEFCWLGLDRVSRGERLGRDA